jgi:hypothetical protein
VSASTLRWPLLALLALLVAGAVAFLATRAVSTDIGISSEPPNAGRSLSPAAPKARPPKTGTRTTTTTVPPIATVTVPSPSGGSRGGDGESGDD